jgi:gamma-glutamyltranspeptidase/glutathione hydrolase
MLPSYRFRWAIYFLILSILSCTEVWNPNYKIGKKFAIATDHPLASEAGKDIYKSGGNFIDAFVAASFVISVVRPQSTGLGGGGFAIVHSAKDQNTKTFDFRERAAKLSKKKMYLDKNGKVIGKESLFGHSSVAVPGFVPGMLELHSKYGLLPISQVLEPAYRIATDGFEVYPDLESAIEKSKKEMNPAMKKVFLLDGKPLKKGSLLVQKDLAETIQRIIKNGDLEFREGESIQKIVQSMKDNSGILSMEDFRNYKVKIQDPIHIQYRGLDIYSQPPPSSAVFLFQILLMLEKEKLLSLKDSRPVAYYQFLAEAMRFGYKDRSLFGGDPEFTKISVPDLLKESRIKEYYYMVQSSIEKQNKNDSLNNKSTLPKNVPETLESYNTTHISIIDGEGNSVSSTHSINYIFGSRILVPGTGIILNDTMDDFAISPNASNAYGLIGGDANSIAPGKTPLSSMSPILVFQDDKIKYAIGAPGGSFIPNAIIQTLVNRWDFKLSPFESVESPRIHHQYSPDILFAEEELKDSLKSLDNTYYTIQYTSSRAKVFYVERGDDGRLHAVSDPRGQGVPSVY